MIVQCKKCFDYLNKISKDLAFCWVRLCQMFVMNNGIMVLDESKLKEANQIIKTLEQKGYITTLDGQSILLRVEGYHFVEPDLEFFCIDSMHKTKGEK